MQLRHDDRGEGAGLTILLVLMIIIAIVFAVGLAQDYEDKCKAKGGVMISDGSRCSK